MEMWAGDWDGSWNGQDGDWTEEAETATAQAQAPAPTNATGAVSGVLVKPPNRGGGGTQAAAHPPLTVSGCNSELLAPHLRGNFTFKEENHGKPVYQRPPAGSSQVTTLIYFWDDRDGEAVSGWWMGPKVGGDEVWAFNGNKASMTPPTTGWQVPWDAAVDASVQLTFSSAPAAAAGAPAKPLLILGPAGGAKAGLKVVPPPFRKQQQWEDPAEAQRKKEELEKAREEEAARKAKQEEEMAQEMARKEALVAEQKKRRQEEETRRSEQAAAVLVRKVIQKVKVATPATYDELLQELETFSLEKLEEMGSQAERVYAEAERALTMAQERVQLLTDQRDAEDKKKGRDDVKRQETADRVKKILVEASKVVRDAELKVAAAADATEPLAPDASLGEKSSPEDILAGIKAVADPLATAKGALDDASKALVEKAAEVGEKDDECVESLRTEIRPLFSKIAAGRRSLAALLELEKTAKMRASRKASVIKRETEEKEKLKKFDVDNDDKLSRDEVTAFVQAEYEFKLDSDHLDRIFEQLANGSDGVPLGESRRLRSMADNARREQAEAELKAKEEAKERERVEAEEKRQAALQARREAFTKAIEGMVEALDEAEAAIKKADVASVTCRRSGEDAGGSSVEKVRGLATEADEACRTAREALARAAERGAECEQQQPDDEENDEIKNHIGRELPRHKGREKRLQARLHQATTNAQAASIQVVRQEFSALNSLWIGAAVGLRAYIASTSPTKTNDEMFEEACKGGSSNGGVTLPGFQALVKSLPGIGDAGEEDKRWSDEQTAKLFAHMANNGETISKEKLLELTRIYYKVTKPTVLTESEAITSKATRRLEDGEVLELLEGPKQEGGSGLARVRCRRWGKPKDDADEEPEEQESKESEGWATVTGNQGTVFLQPLGRFLICNADMPMTKELPADSEELRSVKHGEAVEVLERQKKRIRATVGGSTGWLSLVAPTPPADRFPKIAGAGVAFLEVR